MLTYPQLLQFPVTRRRRFRTLVNTAPDGRSIKLADPGAQQTEWQLKYTDMTDAELAVLQEFHAAAEGSLNSFTFLDPAGNLLAWSGDLKNKVWKAEPLLALAGDAGGWQLQNSGAAPQSLHQTLNAPASYLYCFSVTARAAAPATVTLTIGSNRFHRAVGTDWSRISAAGQGNPNGESILFAIEVPAGATIEILGPQVEAQAAPSAYRISTTGGVYEGARFRDDDFKFKTTAPNRHSTTVNILYANHL